MRRKVDLVRLLLLELLAGVIAVLFYCFYKATRPSDQRKFFSYREDKQQKMADSDTRELISNLSDSSFVILGQGSLPPQLSEDTNQIQNLDSFTKVKTAFSILDSNKTCISGKYQNKWWDGNELSEEYVQKKFEDLMKENYQLKETLIQNNLAIKSQLDTFFMWQQEVLKTHETHKEKFLETKDLILKLRGENTNLKKRLQSLPELSLGTSDEVHSESDERIEKLNMLTEKAREYEMICNELTIKNGNLDTKNQTLKEELKCAKNEILKLNNEIEDIGRENLYLKQKNNNSLGSLSPKSLPNAEARTQISNLLKQLEEEKGKTLILKEELRKSEARNNESSPFKLNAAEEMKQCIDEIYNMNTSMVRQNQRFSSVQSWISLAEENLKDNKVSEGVECNLMCEIKELKSHLKQEENIFREKQESLQELNEQFNRLLEDYKTLQLQLCSVKNYESDIEKYKEDVSSLSIKLKTKDKELIAKQQECDDLKETIKKLTLDCEEVAALRIQAELFQNDFTCERTAKEKLVGEKSEMLEKIVFLENKIEALEKNEGIGNRSTLSTSPPQSQSHSESTGKKTKYICPKCAFSFSDLKVCEEHVEECLNIHFYPF